MDHSFSFHSLIPQNLSNPESVHRNFPENFFKSENILHLPQVLSKQTLVMNTEGCKTHKVLGRNNKIKK